jgi:septin family protein
MAEITEPFQELNVGIVNEDGDQLTDSITDTQFMEFRTKCKRFRVLIIGPRNAGKTTILERLTGDKIERAEFKSPEGNLVRTSIGVVSWETIHLLIRSMGNLREVCM